MAITIDKQSGGAVKIQKDNNQPTYLENLGNVDTSIVQMHDGQGGLIPSILVSWNGGYRIFSYAELGNINGAAKPGTIEGTKDLLGSNVFLFGGTSGATPEQLGSKANLVGGKVPLTEIPSIDLFTPDADIIAAINAAVFSEKKRAVIVPANGKIMYQGQQYYNLTQNVMYVAIADNSVYILSGDIVVSTDGVKRRMITSTSGVITTTTTL